MSKLVFQSLKREEKDVDSSPADEESIYVQSEQVKRT
jgi:hypothetical protein